MRFASCARGESDYLKKGVKGLKALKRMFAVALSACLLALATGYARSESSLEPLTGTSLGRALPATAANLCGRLAELQTRGENPALNPKWWPQFVHESAPSAAVVPSEKQRECAVRLGFLWEELRLVLAAKSALATTPVGNDSLTPPPSGKIQISGLDLSLDFPAPSAPPPQAAALQNKRGQQYEELLEMLLEKLRQQVLRDSENP